MGGPSWQFKKFADASSKAWFGRKWQDKVFGGFTNSASLNGDKQVTLIALQTLASQHGGLWVSLGLLPANTKSAQRTDVNNLGGSVGLLVQTPADAGWTKCCLAIWIPPGFMASALRVSPPSWRDAAPLIRRDGGIFPEVFLARASRRSFFLHNWRVYCDVLLARLG